ncbi:hypothetical protein Tco_1537610 [Tanacetum coccineum]
MVGLRGSRKRPCEVEEPGLTEEIYFSTIPRNSLTDAPIILEGEIYHPLGLIHLKVTMGDSERNKSVLLEFSIVKCHYPYYVTLERTGMRSLRVADKGNAKFIERNAMAPTHGADVKDKRARHITKPKHTQPKAWKGAYGHRRILGG